VESGKMKKVLTTYIIPREEIEVAVMKILREKYPELEDEFEGELIFHYSTNDVNNRTIPNNGKLDAVIQLTEEKP
jgi:hypothetical protein